MADIVKIADQEDPGHDEIQVRFDELDPGQEGLERVERTFTWREEKPNSNNTNPPLLLWRGDENNDATISLAFGVYDQEFTDLKEEYMKIEVETSDGRKLEETCSVELNHPKNEKLARKALGLAASGSDYLCTYCTASHKNAVENPITENLGVTLTNKLLKESAQYCQMNPGKKSQA